MAFTAVECARCREDFPSLARTLGDHPLAYLDGPAGTQVPQAVIDAVTAYYTTSNANTHGAFVTSEETDLLLREARTAVATLLGAPTWRGISFGANMTSLAFALSQAMARELTPGDEILITQLDHEANRGPWLNLQANGVVVREVAFGSDGHLDARDVERKITRRTRLVCVGLASNALGTVNDLPTIRALAKAVDAALVVDAVHYAPHFPLDVATLGVDALLCSAYKFYGPHVGILYTRPGFLERLRPDRLRTQEDSPPEKIETGTLNHAAIAGVKAAIEYLAGWGEGSTLRQRVVSAMAGISAWEHGLAARYHAGVSAIPGVTAWGPGFEDAHRAPTVSITIDGVHPADAARRLGERGVLVWDGHFYALRVVEVLDLAERGGLLRAGMSMYTTPEEVDRLLEGVEAIARSA